MSLQVIGAGVGRTGTNSLKLALEHLGYGPCHHMSEIIANMPTQLPLWQRATQGPADWGATYAGYNSAVDWPTASYYRELLAAYPKAKFILSVRDAEAWVESFSGTIYKLWDGKDDAPEAMRPWLAWGEIVLMKAGLAHGLDKAGLAAFFERHNAAVKATIPADQLLIYQVKEGWGPLCAYLGEPVPAEPFPRTNDRQDFWDNVNMSGKK